jgi:hypothetical protein
MLIQGDWGDDSNKKIAPENARLRALWGEIIDAWVAL